MLRARAATGALRAGQRGVFILTLILVLVITSSTFLFAALNNRTQTHLRDQSEMHYQMAQAKQALLAYAANTDLNFSSGPGHLPCPDLDDDHLPDTDCAPDTGNLGRLPEYALLDITNVDGDQMRYYFSSYYANTDRQFWYAVTPAFLRSSAQTSVLNSSTSSTLSVDGSSGYVAVIIAPNETLGTQDRSTDVTNSANYLEGSNVSGPAFINAYPSNAEFFNDSVIGITKTELMTASTLAVTRRIKEQLDCFHDSNPWFSSAYPSAWFWSAQTWFSYAINSYTGSGCSSGATSWLKDDTVNVSGAQQWASDTSYGYVSADSATLKYSSCAITYTITYGGGITRDKTSC